MNTKLALTAIAMFAVILGMSALTPAMAAPNNERSSATTPVCHFFAVYVDADGDGIPDIDPTTGEKTLIDEESFWGVLYVSSRGAEKGHTNHGDATDLTDDQIIACALNQDGTVTPPPVA